MIFWIKLAIVLKIIESKSIYNKIKSFGDDATDFHDKDINKLGSNDVCLAVILIDFVLSKYEQLLGTSFFNPNQPGISWH